MTRFEKWFIRRVFKRDFRQGPLHSANISNVYRLVREVCDAEFTEDNEPTRDAHLRECFESTQYKSVLSEGK
jgi:hypothetical protein